MNYKILEHLAYAHLHFTIKQELFSEIKFSRVMNVLENISQELYHLISQQKTCQELYHQLKFKKKRI
ncbi:UNVERIFIED_CONTAM: hypothetical protein RMT77_004203 [Armadillidium vulgare]